MNDDDDKKTAQSNTDIVSTDDYQKILDEYAASVKPEDTETQPAPAENTTTEPESIAKLEEVNSTNDKAEEPAKLKDVNSPQLEAPDELALPHEVPASSSEPETESEVKLTDEPELESQPSTPIISETKTEAAAEPKQAEPQPTPVVNQDNNETPKTPEEIKAQIDQILSDDSSTTSTPPKKSNSLKHIFILSLLIFFTVAGFWIYFLFFYQPVANTSTSSSISTTPITTPTKTVSTEICELNGKTYSVGDSFKSADGCNTCTCEAADNIICTEMACDLTPTTSATSSATKITVTPTKSATTSDWKTYIDKEIGFSFNYPKNITLTKKTSDGVFSLSINDSQNLAEGVNMITGITVNRGGAPLDFGGYTKNGNQITYFSNKDKSEICDSEVIKKIYKNQNDVEIVMLENLDKSITYLGSCGTVTGGIKALINTQNKTYPGIAFTSSSLITESDLLKILDTFKFN